MPVITARHTIASMWLILFSAKNRQLTEGERNELNRLCEVLKGGIPERPFYNQAVREFCAMLISSGVFENVNAADVDGLLDKLDCLKLLVG